MNLKRKTKQNKKNMNICIMRLTWAYNYIDVVTPKNTYKYRIPHRTGPKSDTLLFEN